MFLFVKKLVAKPSKEAERKGKAKQTMFALDSSHAKKIVARSY